MSRFAWLAVLVVCAVTTPPWLFIMVMIAYAFWYAGLEIVVMAAGIDALFMPQGMVVPVYTLVSIVVLVVTELLRPYFFVE